MQKNSRSTFESVSVKSSVLANCKDELFEPMKRRVRLWFLTNQEALHLDAYLCLFDVEASCLKWKRLVIEGDCFRCCSPGVVVLIEL